MSIVAEVVSVSVSGKWYFYYITKYDHIRISKIVLCCKLGIPEYITLIECENSDGLIGFKYSHDGFWLGIDIVEGSKTLVACARACRENPNCVAFSLASIWRRGSMPITECHHYTNMSEITDASKMEWKESRAYIKCAGIRRTMILENFE